VGSGSTQPTAPTVTGLGTWAQVGTDIIVDSTGGDRSTSFMFSATAGASSGPITITFNPPFAGWGNYVVSEIVGADTTAPIVQFVKNELVPAALTASVTLAPFASSDNMLYAGLGSQMSDTVTWNITKSGEAHAASLSYAGTAYNMGDSVLTATANWATSRRSGIWGIEVKPASGAPPITAVPQSIPAPSDTPFGTPGSIFGVEIESHGHNPPLLAPNGDLYKVMESDNVSGNHPMMMRSSDGGHTWTEQDSINRPTAQDQEGCWVQMVGTTFLYAITRDDAVWLCPFDTATNTWGTQETIDSGLSTGGVEQYISFTHPSDGKYWFFYSDTLQGTNNQIAYRQRTAPGIYGTKFDLGQDIAVNWTAPASILGAGDLTYVFYKNNNTSTLVYRTLTASGTLSAAIPCATATANDHISNTNAVYWDDAGVENIAIAYADSSDILKLVRFAGGVQQTTETISLAAITMDPGSVTNGGSVAHLANHGSTLYAIWSDGASGDVLMRVRTSGTWGSVIRLWDSGTNAAWYTYNNVLVRKDGTVSLAFVWDVTHGVDVSDVRYSEYRIAGGQVGAPTATIALASLHGSASGSFSWAGSATGHAPVVGANYGHANGTVTWTGLATGHAEKHGSVTGSLAWSGTTHGTEPDRGSGSGQFSWAGQATGHAPIVISPGDNVGSTVGSIVWTGEAIGHTIPASIGRGLGDTVWTGEALGRRPWLFQGVVTDQYVLTDEPLFEGLQIHTGVTVLKTGGSYRTAVNPSPEELEAADVAYIGGYIYQVSDDEAAALVNAGYEVSR
jgi:hypothetical protein